VRVLDVADHDLAGESQRGQVGARDHRSQRVSLDAHDVQAGPGGGDQVAADPAAEVDQPRPRAAVGCPTGPRPRVAVGCPTGTSPG
jgi:hypothetical protein